MLQTKLILASASPRRHELLRSVGVDFDVVVTDIDESQKPDEKPRDYVIRLSQEKAVAAENSVDENAAILAADTIVVKGEQIFTKPTEKSHAITMWQQLSNSNNTVITAVCMNVRGKLTTVVSETLVQFTQITEQQMEKYWQTGEPQDKAGGYAIQGLASAWVEKIDGSYSNVVGLPLREVNELLREINLHWL